MLERLNDNYPYYLDYFGIFKEYQNSGYGSKALKYLLDNIIKDNGLIGEIEKVDPNNTNTIKRLEFYKDFGFKEIDSEYLLYDVLYNPLVYSNKITTKEEVDRILFDYYKTNCGIKEYNEKYRIVK